MTKDEAADQIRRLLEDHGLDFTIGREIIARAHAITKVSALVAAGIGAFGVVVIRVDKTGIHAEMAHDTRQEFQAHVGRIVEKVSGAGIDALDEVEEDVRALARAFGAVGINSRMDDGTVVHQNLDEEPS